MPLTLVKEVLWRASSMLQDIAPQFNLHTEREMVDWLNDAEMACAIYMPWSCSRTDVIRLQAGTKQSVELLVAADVKVGGGAVSAVPVQGIQLLDVIRNMGTDGATPGIAIPDPIDRRILDLNRPAWHTTPGDVVRQYTFDPRTPKQFYVQPGAPAGRNWVEIAYIALPDRITGAGTPEAPVYDFAGDSTTKITVSDENVNDLVNYICARATMKSAEASVDDVRSNRYTGLFVGSINSRVQALTGNNPNLKRLPLAPEPAGQAS